MGKTQTRANTRFAPTDNKKLLAALFAEAKKLGIEQDALRNEIAYAVIKKRLSMASGQEILRVIEHITGKAPRNHPYPPASPLSKGGTRGVKEGIKGRYESSKAGLLQEVEDLAKARFGEGFEMPLKALINANRKIPTHYKFLDVAGLLSIKKVIVRLNEEGPYQGMGDHKDAPLQTGTKE